MFAGSIRRRGLGTCLILIVLDSVVQIFGKSSVPDLKVWQCYVDNELSLIAERITLPDNKLSLAAVIHGLYNLTKFYSTCRSQDRQFAHTVTYHSLWTVCSYLQISVPSSANFNNHTLEISSPKPLGFNITVLRFTSGHDPVNCETAMAVGLDGRYDDGFCGNPYLGRSVIIGHHTADISFLHNHREKSFLNISLHIQAVASLGRPALDEYDFPEVESHIYPISLQTFHGKYYGASVVSLTASLHSAHKDRGLAVMNSIVGVTLFSSNCNPDGLDVFALYDGPYAGVLSTSGLISPFQLLMEGTCQDVPIGGHLSYNSSIGDLTLVVRSSSLHDTAFVWHFHLDIPAQCPGQSCKTTTVEVIRDKVQTWSSASPQQPLKQVVKFVTKTPNSYIKLKLDVIEANVPRAEIYGCRTEGIYIYEEEIVAYICSGEGFSILKRNMEESGGLQFNTIPVTVVLKTYPQTTKLRLNISFTGTSCFGMVNHCFHLTESVFGHWKSNSDMHSCLPQFDSRYIHSAGDIYVHLKPNCCVQWHMISFDDTVESGVACMFGFYAPKNDIYRWQIDVDDTTNVQESCLRVTFDATDYPLRYLWNVSGDPDQAPPGMFTLDKPTTLRSAYIRIRFRFVCYHFGPVRMGIRITGTGHNFTESSSCNNESLSYTKSPKEESDMLVSFKFEPFHRCAAFHLPSISTEYSFNFNFDKDLIKIQNTIYPFESWGRCCFIHLVLRKGTPVTAKRKDSFRYSVTNDGTNVACHTYVCYHGIPQSLVLRDFAVFHTSEAFSIGKSNGSSSFSIGYYLRERNKLEIHTRIFKIGACHDANVSCTVCTRRQCYTIYFSGTFSWNEADMTCRLNGSHLISLNDQYEWYHAVRLLDHLCINNVFLHIGLEMEVGLFF